MSMDRVVLLDENTANRIAAGEVVERPASAVKELVENAIDAGAAQISIMLEEGGKHRIVVSDNGVGMSRADAIMSLQRHATSKIQSADDLFAIHTLGFRGEALPSIASVSRFTMTTKPAEDDSGTCLRVLGGDISDVEEAAAKDGTVIEVADLFFNTPARLKFLKSTAAEMSRTVEAVGQLAIAYPHVSFRIRHGSQDVFSTPGTGEPLAALAAVWGRDTAKKLVPVRNEDAGLKVWGHVATPDISRPGRSHELIFVNRRPIKNRLIAHALEDAFRSLTPDSRFPIAALFVEINPALVDVNVHPTKTEVKFTRDGEVHHAVSQAIKKALLDYGIVPSARMTSGTAATSMAPAATGQGFLDIPQSRTESRGSVEAAILAFAPVIPDSADAVLADSLVQAPLPPPEAPSPPVGSDGEADPFAEPLEERERPKPFAEQLRQFKVLGQARNTYIIAMTPDGIAVIDQHVAHERVIYERLTVKRFSNGIPVQRLAVPVTLHLSKREALLLSEHLKSFADSGWDIAPFGGESFVVRSVPAVLAHKPYEEILRDMVDELVNQSVSRRLLVQKDHVTITNACKMAVKAGDPLTLPEMEGLLEQLAETENPYLCPHGRPIVVMVTFDEIDKQFKRA